MQTNQEKQLLAILWQVTKEKTKQKEGRLKEAKMPCQILDENTKGNRT